MRPPVSALSGLEGLGASWTLGSPKAMARSQESMLSQSSLVVLQHFFSTETF